MYLPRGRTPDLPLIANLAQKIVSPVYVGLTLYTFGRTAIDDAENTSALLTFSDDFDWVGGSTEYGTDLGHVANHVQQIDRVSILEHHNKRVTAT